ncbi:MAG: outer membrane protein assembly factor BamA [Proteobacteria bacterium]|nr:outer membrane protein assembly factor BamA [Pseudomonadota bacterium]
MSNLLKGVALILFMSLSSASSAFDTFVMEDIRVEGIQRTDPGVIFSNIPVQVGDSVDKEVASQIIRSLFKTGFFDDVQVLIEGSVLVVRLIERPAVYKISVSGSKLLTEEQIIEALSQMGLSESAILDGSILDLAEQELKNLYMSKGKYGVEIITTTTPLERNRVAVTFDVFEGPKALIEKINFVGNVFFSDGELRDEMGLKSPGRINIFKGPLEYSKQKLEADQETIRSLYLDNGYADFLIESTQVQLSPDREHVFITMSFSEGEKFVFDSIAMAGDTVVSSEDLFQLVDIVPGEVFSRKRLTDLSRKITDRLGEDGYANATVNPVPEKDVESSKIGFTLYVNAGQRVYVRRIDINGNIDTRDEVIRRELRQMEGTWYSIKDINRSKQRLNLLGFFSDVIINTNTVPGAPDQVDLEVKVVERMTGNFTVGMGFSSTDKLLLQLGLSQNNFMGTGNSLGFTVSSGKINETYEINYTNPYATDDGVSRTYKLGKRDTDVSSLVVSAFSTSTSSGSVTFGVPLTEYDRIYYGLGVEATQITLGANPTAEYEEFVALNGSDNTVIPLTVGWSRDKRNSAIYPTDGMVQRFSTELATPAGDLYYYNLSYKTEWYRPVTDDLTLRLVGSVAYAEDYDSKQLPFYKNFYAGGATSVRGYQSSSIGPKNSLGQSLGGKRRMLSQAEIIFPLPGLNLDKSMRFAFFVDGGAVTNHFEDGVDEMRYSTGIGFNWYSPVGPMRFNFAKPLNAKATDRTEAFQFTLGTGF